MYDTASIHTLDGVFCTYLLSLSTGALSKLKAQLADTKGDFKRKERKTE